MFETEKSDVGMERVRSPRHLGQGGIATRIALHRLLAETPIPAKPATGLGGKDAPQITRTAPAVYLEMVREMLLPGLTAFGPRAEQRMKLPNWLEGTQLRNERAQSISPRQA